MNKQQKATLAVATIGAIATFFPWIVFSAGAFGYSVSESIDGFNGSGVLYLFVMLGAGVWAVIGKQFEAVQKYSRLITLTLGVLSVFLIITFYSSKRGEASNPYGSVSSSIGIGIILAFLSSLSLIAIPLVVKLPDTPSLQDDFSAFKDLLQGVQKSVDTNKISIRPATRPAKPNRMEEMEKLIAWRNDGKISQEEFDELKSRIM